MYILDYIKTVNEEQYQDLKKQISLSGPKQFLDSVMKDGIYIHQPPFWNNVNIDELKAIYNKYDWIKPYNCTIKGKPMIKPLIIAQEYFMKLMF